MTEKKKALDAGDGNYNLLSWCFWRITKCFLMRFSSGRSPHCPGGSLRWVSVPCFFADNDTSWEREMGLFVQTFRQWTLSALPLGLNTCCAVRKQRLRDVWRLMKKKRLWDRSNTSVPRQRRRRRRRRVSVNVGQVLVVPAEVPSCVNPVLAVRVRVCAHLEPPAKKKQARVFSDRPHYLGG